MCNKLAKNLTEENYLSVSAILGYTKYFQYYISVGANYNIV